MCFRGSTIRGKMNRADRYVLSALSRTAGARRQVPERREKDERETPRCEAALAELRARMRRREQ